MEGNFKITVVPLNMLIVKFKISTKTAQ